MDTDWKQWEREVAKDLGGIRTGPLGTSYPDVIVSGLSVECKLSKHINITSQDILQAKRNAVTNSTWIVAKKQRRQKGQKDCNKIVAMDYDTFINLMKGIK